MIIFTKKKLKTAAILMIAALWSYFPLTASAYDFTTGGIYYNIDGENAIVTYPNSSKPSSENPSTYSGSVSIPAKVTCDGKTYNVTEIGERAFYYSSLQSVEMAEGLQIVSKQAFSFCRKLKELTFPNSVTNIGFDAAAYSDALERVSLGNGVVKIEQGAFYSSAVSKAFVNPTLPPEIANYLFSSSPIIYVKVNAAEAYKESAWSNFGEIEETFDLEYTFADLQEILNSYDQDSYKAGSLPGQYSPKSVESYLQALSQARSLTSSSAAAEISAAIKTLIQSTPQQNKIQEGYYRILSAGNGPGYSGGPYNYENKVAWYNQENIVRWIDYDANDYGMIYRLIANKEGWNIFNLKDESYVSQGTASYSCNVTTSLEAKKQIFTHVDDGKFIIQAEGAPHVYALTNSHNGTAQEMGTLNVWGTPQEAANYGVNLWYIVPVAEEVVEYLEQNDNTLSYSISLTPVAPKAGKRYALRNATTSTYLTSNGPLTNSVETEPEYFWTLEESGREIDGQTLYFLKSASYNAYWKQINYGERTWDDLTPYDAYDWYDYAGFNGEFSSQQSEAMEITVLAAGSTNTWRSQGATQGYVLAMKDPITTKENYYYKLGCQDNNVGMEPWNENVGWEFLPVTISGNIQSDVENALDAYGNLDLDVQTSADPGYFDTQKMATYAQALQALQNLDGQESRQTIKTMIANLKSAYEAAKEPNQIREGYFYIVTAGDGPGYSGGPYNYEWKSAMYNDGENVWWTTYDPSDFRQIYYISPDEQGDWLIQSALEQTYINRGASTYATNISTSLLPETSQQFTLIKEGKWAINFKGNPYIYTVAASHNGSDAETGKLNIWGTPQEAANYGVNLWFLKTVPDNILEDFAKTDAGLMALCVNYENLANSMPTDTIPGYYKQENVNALLQTIEEAKTKVFEQTTEEEKLQIRQTLKEAYQNACQTVPLSDGYYYLINNSEAYFKAFGNYAALYTAPEFSLSANGSACYYDTFSPSNANYIYKVERQAEDTEKFKVLNAHTGWYLNTGDGNSQSGEIMTCTKEFKTPQIIRWHSAGRFWIADETDNQVGHSLANIQSTNRRDFIVGGPQFDANLSDPYHTWALLPLSSQQASLILNNQKATDAATALSYGAMLSYLDSIASRYNMIVNDRDNAFNLDAVTALKSKYKIVTNLISCRPYDIASTKEDYQNATEELRAAISYALTATPDSTASHQLTGTPIGAISVDYTTSQPSETINTPADVFDSDFTTYYAAYERSTGWVGLDLGEKHIIHRIAYAPRASWANRLMLGVFEGANKPDFSDAIPFYIIKSTPEYEQMTYAQINCTRAFRYVRYVGPNDARCNISELRFYGEKGEGDDSHLYQATNLPLVVFRTTANVSDVTSKTTWLPGHVNIISEDGAALKTDSMKVRGRGNGSWSFEKKPYKLKLESKAKLLGMPAKAREWTLINNYGDKTMVRNNLAFKLSEIFEMDYTPACSLVDVIFNGQYKGSYQLCDQIEVRKNRVNVTEMTPDDNQGEELTGGYLIELDAYASGEPKHFSSSIYGIPVTVHYPDDDEITDEQFQYVQQSFNQLCQSLYSSDYKSEETGYRKHMDQETWLKYFLIEELSGNTDGYWSTYMYRERGYESKWRTCPVWDFDLAFDNDGRTHPILTMTEYLSLSSKSSAASGVRNFNRKIVESCQKELKELWSWYRYRGDLNYEVLHAVIDSLYETNKASAEINYIRWPILNVRTQQQYTTRGSYKAECDFLSEYIYDRLAWMDNKVGLEEPIGIHSAQDQLEARGGIHVLNNDLLLRGFKEGSIAHIYTPDGQQAATLTIEGFDNRISLAKGIYIVRLIEAGGKSTTKKIIIK